MNTTLWLGAALAAVLALWRIDHLQQALDQQAELIALQAEQVTLQQQLIDQQRAALDQQQALQGAVTVITRTARETQQRIDRQTTALRQDLQQLRRTDESLDAYLLSPVPAVVGLRYARPASADPAAWRNGAPLRSGAVPAAGSPGAAAQ